MAKYFISWETDESLWPSKPKEQGSLALKLGGMVKQDIEDGKVTDWGVYVGGDRGYMIAEGEAVDLYRNLQRFHPYVDFMVHQVVSIDDVLGVQKARTE
ncbi:MAG: hypothetical protein JSW38_11660 [Dehalococcoidia bacterium]|nr:MAG: hypothetical protein JSW38_11660 [Dehalococcoidia bacterium]